MTPEVGFPMNDETIDALLAKAAKPAEDAMRLHPYYRGKVQMMPKCRVEGLADFSVWYTPGVAAPCRAISEARELVYEHTNRANTIAIVSDGSRVLGLGDIGPEAGLPVMEGKALLFKYLGGVDAVPLCLRASDADDIVHAVKMVEPSFGGINLEDISAPKCFRVLQDLCAELDIPVWHDDQQGTATVLVAGLGNALKISGKSLQSARIALVGVGAANVAVYRLLMSVGVDPGGIVACDSRGVLHPQRGDLEEAQTENPQKWRVCVESNAEGVRGGVSDAMRGADAVVAFSAPQPGIIQPAWVRSMAQRPVVFACANPQPEIWPWQAKEAGAAIVATGRSDFPNQLNNSLCFPGVFRGVLDVRARSITDSMALEAARALAGFAEGRGMREDDILPHMDEWDVHLQVAVATALEAQRSGIAGLRRSEHELLEAASQAMGNARAATAVLMREGLIAPSPP